MFLITTVVILGLHLDAKDKKKKQRPKIDRPYQFGNGHSTTGNNAKARRGLSLTLIMRPVCHRTWRRGSLTYLCLLG